VLNESTTNIVGTQNHYLLLKNELANHAIP
jgi:hypothetical protein